MKKHNEGFSIVDSFGITDQSWRIDESAESQSVVDGVHILGRAAGPFFLINGESLNKRFYSEELWTKAVNESKSVIEDGQMIGTIGHETEINDIALLEGKVSHRISKIWIDKDKKLGMGEVLILNTTAGQNLNNLLRGGVNLSISSRAFGDFTNKTTSSGAKVVDPNKFKLEGFDFVRSPGVPIARPKLVESTGSDSDSSLIDNEREDSKMSNEILETLTKDKSMLQSQLTEALSKINDLSNRISENEVTSRINEVKTELREVKAKLQEYSTLGTPSEIQLSLSKANEAMKVLASKHASDLNEYKVLGNPLEISKSLDLLESYTKLGSISWIKDKISSVPEKSGISEEYVKLGTPKEISEVFSIVEEYRNLGTPEEISKVFTISEEYASLGTPKEINTVFGHFEDYTKIGTPEEFNKALGILESYTRLGKEEDILKVSKLAEKYLEFGTLEDLDRVLKIAEEYANLGSPADINEAFDLIESVATDLVAPEQITELENVVREYTELGTINDLTKIMKVAEEYTKLGTPEEISNAFDLAEGLVNKTESIKLRKDSEDLAVNYGVNVSTVESLVKKLGKEEAIKTLDEMMDSASFSTRYRKPTASNLSETVEDTVEATMMSKSRIDRLFTTMSR